MSRDAVRTYVVAYDVSDDRRRTRLAHRLQAYGDRVQYSVFLIDARPARMIRLGRVLTGLIDAERDGVLICDIGPRTEATAARLQYLGRRARTFGDGPLIV